VRWYGGAWVPCLRPTARCAVGLHGMTPVVGARASPYSSLMSAALMTSALRPAVMLAFCHPILTVRCVPAATYDDVMSCYTNSVERGVRGENAHSRRAMTMLTQPRTLQQATHHVA
jgi:hypothetical protein